MRESLRGRLLLWYTVIVATIVAAFGAGVTYLTWRARLADIDANRDYGDVASFAVHGACSSCLGRSPVH